MFYKNTESVTRPSAVTLERLPDDTARVTLCDNIRAEERDGQEVFTYDEVVFYLEAGRKETDADIEAEFSAWWVFGSTPEEPAPTVEERLSAVEDILMDILGGE